MIVTKEFYIHKGNPVPRKTVFILRQDPGFRAACSSIDELMTDEDLIPSNDS